jgi:heme o synthase
MQFVSLGLGYLLARPDLSATGEKFAIAIIGTAFVSGGAAALNHALEIPQDAKMERTKNRPLPSSRIKGWAALTLGLGLIGAGLIVLWSGVDSTTTGLAALTAFLYLAIYTPLKRVHWLNTYVGALPGAIPPLAGWVIATGAIQPPAWIVAGILAIWQIPHFFAIAWMYKMLPEIDSSGDKTVSHMLVSTVLLLGITLSPMSFGLLGWAYTATALLLGVWFLRAVYKFSKDRSVANARVVLKTSVYYLPLLLLAMGLDRLI